jgi:lipid II:glycine glycyltransferase (peptidoglycan interpeptide bridge formation enzyme)
MQSNLNIITNADQLKKAGWKEYVQQHTHGNFFQLPEAHDLFSKVTGYTPVVIGCTDASNSLQGILLCVIQQEPAFYGRLTSRAIVWGGPVCSSPQAASALLKEYDKQISGKAIYSQFRNMFDCSSIKPAFLDQGFTALEHLNYLVNTADTTPEQLLTAMSKSKARQIKKGIQSATIVEATTQAEADEFYFLLKKLYTEKVHKPLPPKIFFDAYLTDIVSKGLGKYLLIKLEGKVIGGIMSPVMPGKAIYEWYIAGLDKDYKEQYPSILATWAAIKAGSEEQLQHFDFLGAGKPDADYGVREFKAKFGGELVNYGRFEKIHQPLLMKVGTLGLKFYKFIKG